MRLAKLSRDLALISNYGYPDRVRFGSRNLRCVLLWHSLADEVAVVSTPSLQRLIIYFTHTSESNGVIKVKIGHAPELVVLGYLDTATHQLEIGNTFIKAGLVSDDKLVDLLDLALFADTANTVKALCDIAETGVEPLSLMSQLATIIIDILAVSKEDMEKLCQAYCKHFLKLKTIEGL
ncbi:hypothetical protein ZWY2020_042426 [Hordeum vulgare]|nr:hypothetical protein ZWY2020_042426 [Hordeum vulgare]